MDDISRFNFTSLLEKHGPLPIFYTEPFDNLKSALGMREYLFLEDDRLVTKKSYINKAWLDLLPASAYINELETESVPQEFEVFLLPLSEDFQMLSNLIQEYHQIQKDKQGKLYPRIQALKQIEKTSVFLLEKYKDTLSLNQLRTLEDIHQVCQNKSRYLFSISNIAKRAMNRAFRLEHIKGSPLRVDHLNADLTQMLVSGFDMEILSDLDPCHRTITFEIQAAWQKAASENPEIKNMWLWLETQDTTLMNQNSLYNVPQKYKRVYFEDGYCKNRLFGEKSNNHLNGKYIYNIGRDGHLYIFNESYFANVGGRYSNHNHILGGSAILSAGVVTFEKGKITEINVDSGHYLPKERHLFGGIRNLKLPEQAFSEDAIARDYGRMDSGKSTPIKKLLHPESVVENSNIEPSNQMLFSSNPPNLSKPDYTEQWVRTDQNNTQSDLIRRVASSDPTITNLDLSSSGIAAGHLEELAEAIPKSQSLAMLDLSHNGLTDSEFSKFVDAVKLNHSLKYIKVEAASLSPESIKKLSDVCKDKEIVLVTAKIASNNKKGF